MTSDPSASLLDVVAYQYTDDESERARTPPYVTPAALLPLIARIHVEFDALGPEHDQRWIVSALLVDETTVGDVRERRRRAPAAQG